MAHTKLEVISMNGSASNHYQKYTWLCVGATVVALLVSAAAFSAKEERAAAQARPAQSHQAVQGQPEKNLTEYYTPNAAASQENSGETPSREESYLVTVYDGKIGVFREGEDEPFLTADTEVYLLPREDVAILEKGIRAQGFGAVKSILEDYQ